MSRCRFLAKFGVLQEQSVCGTNCNNAFAVVDLNVWDSKSAPRVPFRPLVGKANQLRHYNQQQQTQRPLKPNLKLMETNPGGTHL